MNDASLLCYCWISWSFIVYTYCRSKWIYSIDLFYIYEMHKVAKKKEGGATITHNLYLPSCKNEIRNKILASTKQNVFNVHIYKYTYLLSLAKVKISALEINFTHIIKELCDDGKIRYEVSIYNILKCILPRTAKVQVLESQYDSMLTSSFLARKDISLDLWRCFSKLSTGCLLGWWVTKRPSWIRSALYSFMVSSANDNMFYTRYIITVIV